MPTLRLAPFGTTTLAIAFTLGLAADPLEVRMATLAPEGSSWMKLLGKHSAELETATGKRVRFRYYAGGVQGDERDVVRKINLGQLDGAALSLVGLAQVEESIRVLELPRLFATVEELDYVADKMWPYFQAKFEKKGFRLEDRGEIGGVHFFSKEVIKSIGDLKSQKVWLWSDDALARALFKQLGVAGVPLGVPEVEPALTTGRINVAYGSPLAAVALQWHTKVKFMASHPVSFALAATVLKLDTIKKMTKEDQDLTAKAARRLASPLRHQIRKDNESARHQMEQKGVKVAEMTPEMLAGLDKAARAVWKELSGKVYSEAELTMVLKHRDEYRAKSPGR